MCWRGEACCRINYNGNNNKNGYLISEVGRGVVSVRKRSYKGNCGKDSLYQNRSHCELNLRIELKRCLSCPDIKLVILPKDPSE